MQMEELYSTRVREIRLEKMARISGKSMALNLTLYPYSNPPAFITGNSIAITKQKIENKILPSLNEEVWMLLAQRGLTMHELGHNLFTDSKEQRAIEKRNAGRKLAVIKAIIGIVEDGRVDRAVREDFPGAFFAIKKLRENYGKITEEQLENGIKTRDSEVLMSIMNPYYQYIHWLSSYCLYQNTIKVIEDRTRIRDEVFELKNKTKDLVDEALKESNGKKALQIMEKIGAIVYRELQDEWTSTEYDNSSDDSKDGTASSKKANVNEAPLPEDPLGKGVKIEEESEGDGEGQKQNESDSEESEDEDSDNGSENTSTEDEEKDNETDENGEDTEDKSDSEQEDTGSEGDGDTESESDEEDKGEEKTEENNDGDSEENDETGDEEDEETKTKDDSEEEGDDDTEDEEDNDKNLHGSEDGLGDEEREQLKEMEREIGVERQMHQQRRQESDESKQGGEGYSDRVHMMYPDQRKFKLFSEARVTNMSENIGSELMTILRDKTKSDYETNKRSGRLHSRKLHKLPRKDYKVFRKKRKEEELNYQCFILLDRSASMGGGKYPQQSRIYKAEYATLVLTRALEKAGIETEVLAFSEGYYLHKTLGESYDESKMKITTCETYGGTPLRQALEETKNRIRRLSSKNPFIIVVTDGIPNNVPGVEQEIAECPFPVIGVTIGGYSRVKGYYANVYVDHIDSLLTQLSNLVKQLMF